MRRHRGRCDDDKVGARQHAGKPHLHVSRSGWHVDEEIVEFTPVHIVEELFDGLGEHEPAPHERCALVFDEHSRRHDFEETGADTSLVRNDHWFVVPVDPFGLESIGHTEHAWNRKAPDVGIEHTDGGAVSGKGGSQVDGDRALADPTFSTGDREDPRRDGHLGVGRVFAGVPACAIHDGRTFGGGHFVPIDHNFRDGRVHLEAGFDVFFQLGAQGAALDGELETDVHHAVGRDIDVAHHAEVDDVVAQFRVDDRTEEVAHHVGRGQAALRAFVRCAFHDPNVSVSFFA